MRKPQLRCNKDIKHIISIKGTDRLCKVVKLSMQCCGQILQGSFETYKTFPQCIISEFEYIVDAQNHEFGWLGLQNRFFLNYKITTTKNKVTIIQ